MKVAGNSVDPNGNPWWIIFLIALALFLYLQNNIQ